MLPCGAHLKGVAQNLGFDRLQKSASALTEAVRGAVPLTDESLFEEVCKDQKEIVEAIEKLDWVEFERDQKNWEKRPYVFYEKKKPFKSQQLQPLQQIELHNVQSQKNVRLLFKEYHYKIQEVDHPIKTATIKKVGKKPWSWKL